MKKFLFIFALVVSLVLPGAGYKSYAAEVYPDYLPSLPSKQYDFDIQYIIYELVDNGNHLTFLYVIQGLTENSNTILKLRDDYYLFFTMGSTCVIDSYLLSDNVWSVRNSGYQCSENIIGIAGVSTDKDSIKFLFSTVDVLDYETSEVVFPLPPGPLGMPEGTLTQILTQENPLKEILKLLPMAIPCLVGFVALRKALRTLETILKTA